MRHSDRPPTRHPAGGPPTRPPRRRASAPSPGPERARARRASRRPGDNGRMDLARVPVLGRLSARRRPLVGAVVLAVLLLVVGLGAFALTRGSDRIPDRVDQSHPGAVVLVPGYGGSQGSLT